MGMWDMFQGFGESLEDWGGSSGNYGMGSINPAYGESFKGLDMVGFPGPSGPINTPYTAFRQMDRSVPNLSEGFYQGFLNQGRNLAGQGGGFGSWLSNKPEYTYALGLASGQRHNDPFNIPLRNAQHGLVGQVGAMESPFGKFGNLFAIPTYNASKFAAQRGPAWLGQLLDAIGDRTLDSGPNSLTQASPPSWEAVRWGLRPWWGND